MFYKQFKRKLAAWMQEGFMLEKVDLDLSLPKKDYKERKKVLSAQLTLLQRACWENHIPVIILFEGWDASGKGTSINMLASYMDPRGFKIQPIRAASEYERHMPWLWRFWQRIPNYGEIGIFDRSWYGRVLVERVEKLIPPDQWRQGYQDILEFERTLAEDGYMLVKVFLHISKKEQRRRFKTLEKDPLQSWRVQKEDWNHYRKYDDYLEAIEEMLARTETEWGPWMIVEATDRRWAHIKLLGNICSKMEDALTRRGLPVPVVVETQDQIDRGIMPEEVLNA
jgi:AMP-polyphosphate phosphotransferase